MAGLDAGTMRRLGSQKRVPPTRERKSAAAKVRRKSAPLREELHGLPLMDVRAGANVSIRFPATGPVVEIVNVNRVPIDWVRCLIATMSAVK